MSSQTKFLNFRKWRDSKASTGDKTKKRHFMDKESGLPVSEIKAKVRSSDLIKYSEALRLQNRLNVVPLRAPYIFSTYKSIKNNLNNDYVIKRTPWARYIPWDKYQTEFYGWIKENMTEGLVKEAKEYRLKKRPYSLSPFQSTELINHLGRYGINTGSWDTESTKRWTVHAERLMSAIKWTDLNLDDVSDEYGKMENYKEAWQELCIANPMFGLLRHNATSGWPDYHPQTIEYIVRTYWSAIHSAPEGVVTMYHRRHGYSLSVDKRQIGTVVIKVRFVGGVEYVVKIKGLYITWSMKMSRPEWSLYYRPWSPIFSGLTTFIEGYDGIVFTADRKEHDSHHDKGLMHRLKAIVSADMPEHIIKAHDQVFEASFEDPTILISPFEAIKTGRTLAVSGSPPIPLYESLSAGAGTATEVEDQGCELDLEVIQIDDTCHGVSGGFDIPLYTKNLFKKYGEEISPTKTEVIDKSDLINPRKHITLLQVKVGELYINPKDLTFMVPIKTEKNYYLGSPWRREHREEMKERMKHPSHGDIRWRPVEVDFPQEKLVNVQRMLGSLGSHGEQMPVELLDLKLDYLSMMKGKPDKINPIFEDVIEYAKCLPDYDIVDYGFDLWFVLKRINERW